MALRNMEPRSPSGRSEQQTRQRKPVRCGRWRKHTEMQLGVPPPDRCTICEWRRHFIKHSDDDYTDVPSWACDSSNPIIMKGLHMKPSQVWIDIISTSRLCSPSSPVVREGRTWLSIPLRFETDVQSKGAAVGAVRFETDVQCSDCDYCYDGCWKASQETVIGFHNTRLESLVTATPSWAGIPNGSGILVDGRLRYGCSTHNGRSGVNVYSDGGCETFENSKGWVQLEVKCTNTTKLQGGRSNRYCICGPYGEVCYKAALVALWIPYDDVPSIVALS